MKPKAVYLILAALGAVLPYYHFLPWLQEHGLDLPLFFRQLHETHVSEFFAADVIVSAAVVIAFLVYERRKLGRAVWIPVAGLLVFGVSYALPALLYLRENRLQRIRD